MGAARQLREPGMVGFSLNKRYINGVLQGAWSGTIGTWYIDFDEASCHTSWAPIKDKVRSRISRNACIG